jgi:uncharacterized membrane protein
MLELIKYLRMNPTKLRRDFQQNESGDLRRRRAIFNLSLLGIGSMAAVTLLQTGIVKHLPGPPIDGFDSDKVNLSDEAFQFGVPDGTLGLASFAGNLPLAALGDADRARAQPVVPLAAAAKAALDAIVAGYYFYQMPAKERAWCGYCIVGGIASFAVFALTIPEARKAMAALRDGS